MAKKIIEVGNLVKRFNGRKAILNGVSFDVCSNEFVTISGRSGCGKTTLLNILGGLDRPTSGRVEIAGHDITGISENELAKFRLDNIGFVFQDFNLLLDLTVRENVALPLLFSGKRDGARVDELLRKFDIHQIGGEKANRISGGEAQRTAIARAMMNEPKIILADEPTGNLDEENSENVIRMFDIAREEYGTTIVLATHDKTLAPSSTFAIVIEGGKTMIDRTRR